MQIAYIGLGKMGFNMVRRMREHAHEVHAYDASADARERAREEGFHVHDSIADLLAAVSESRTVWLMVPHGVVDEVLRDMLPHLSENDVVIDGGNSYFKESVRRAQELGEQNIHFLDAGVSGGPGGALRGACIMVGGPREVYDRYEQLFDDLTVPEGFGYMGKAGAGHFVKMVHNGIEYGMMQAIAEGFALMHESELDIDLKKVADVYDHGSVVESRLVAWLKDGYDTYGVDLEEISGTVGHTGEGEWTVKTAQEYGIPTPVIASSFQFRVDSEHNPTYTGKILSALRNMFGGHKAKK